MEKNNHFLPKRQIYVKKASEATFGDIEELKNASTLAPEFSVKAKIEEADKVFGLSTGEFLAKYNDPAKYPHGLNPASTDAQVIAGKMLVIDALDKEINVIAGEDLKAKVGALDKGDPKVHEILEGAKTALATINEDVFGGKSEKKLYLKHLESFGLDLNSKDIENKTALAIELKTRIREQQEKEAELALEKLKLEQLKEDSKNIDLRYADYNRITWKIAKIIGVGAVGALAGGVAIPIWAAAGSMTLAFAPQLDFGISKTWNKVKQWWRGSLWGVSGKEKEKQKADVRVQNINGNLSVLQKKENQMKTVIEADLKRLRERRGEVELEMQPITKELRILRSVAPPAVPDAAKIGDVTTRLTAAQNTLTALDNSTGELEKALVVFDLAEKHREKLGNKELLNSIAASEHLPGTGKQIKEIYDAPDTRSIESQTGIYKIKQDEIRYIIEAELEDKDLVAIKNFMVNQFKKVPNPNPVDADINAFKANANTKVLYDLLMSMAKLSKENPFRKNAREIIKKAGQERKNLNDAKKSLTSVSGIKALNAIKDLYEAFSKNKKKTAEKIFSKFNSWKNAAATELKEIYKFFERVKDLAADDSYRKAAVKVIEGVLKDKRIL